MNTGDEDFETQIRLGVLTRLWKVFADECERLPADAPEVNEFVRGLAVEVETLARELRVRSPFMRTSAYRTGLLDA